MSHSRLMPLIQKTARQAGMSEDHTRLILEGFWKAVGEKLTTEGVVKLPGFGLFGVWGLENDETGEIRAVGVPRFVAARAFNNEVGECCRPSEATERRWRPKRAPKAGSACELKPPALTPERRRELMLRDARLWASLGD